jgi:D-sedoheptulose 7-phosphate isomerase
MIHDIENSLREAQEGLNALLASPLTLQAIQTAADRLVQCFEQKGRVFSCGNGGSMCDAMHFAEELTGRYRLDRPGLAATAISDTGHLTCVGNDFGYEAVFSRYLEAQGRAGDCLLGLSTSGTSKNIVRAARTAKDLGMGVIILSGRDRTELETLADVHICTPAGRYADRVQELHIKVIHILIELVERRLFPANYA